MLLNCGVGKDLRVPWISRRSNQSILKEINPGYSLEGLMLKLKLQYVGHLMWRTDSLEKMLTMRKIEGRREGNRENEMVGWHCQFNGHESEQTPEDTEGQGSLVFCSPWDCKELDTTEQLNNNNKFPVFRDFRARSRERFKNKTKQRHLI